MALRCHLALPAQASTYFQRYVRPSGRLAIAEMEFVPNLLNRRAANACETIRPLGAARCSRFFVRSGLEGSSLIACSRIARDADCRSLHWRRTAAERRRNLRSDNDQSKRYPT